MSYCEEGDDNVSHESYDSLSESEVEQKNTVTTNSVDETQQCIINWFVLLIFFYFVVIIL